MGQTDLRNALLERVERADPRILRIAADAGWGKSAFVRALANRHGDAAIVEAPEGGGPETYERTVLEALSRTGTSGATEPLLARWSAGSAPRLVVFEDLHLLDDDALEVVRALLRRLPGGRRVVLTARGAFPLALSRYFAPHEILSLGAADLALSESERRALITADTDVAEPVLARALRISRGWPIATLRFARFAREGRLTLLLDRLQDRAFEDLHLYLESEVLADLTPDELDALTLCACGRGITVDDAASVLGPDAIARLDELEAQRLLVKREAREYRTGLVAAAVARNRPAEIAAMRTRCAASRSARGDHCGAAALWLAAGDAQRAAEALDGAGPPVAGVSPSPRYLRLLLTIPVEALLDTRHAFVALLTSPGVAANALPLYVAVRDLADKLHRDATRERRISTLLALAVFAYYASEVRRADELVAALEAEHRESPFPPERALLCVATSAAVAALRGRTVDAAARWDAATLERPDGATIFEMQRFMLHFALALSAGDAHRLGPEIRRYVAMARESADPLWIADARVYESAFLHVADDVAASPEAMLHAIEREELAAVEPAAYRHITRAAELPSEARNILSCLTLIGMAYAQGDAVTARRMVESAIAALDRLGRPHHQIAARLAAAHVPGEPAGRLYEEARAIASEVQDPRTAASVEAFIAGRLEDAICFPFAVQLVRRSRFGVESSLRVEILRGRVLRDGVPIALRSREFELLAALALAGTPLSRASLAQRLWGEDAAEDAGPALRTAVHRLRKQLGDPNAVLFHRGAYGLAPTVSVDLQEVEATLAALGQLPALTERERDRLRGISAALGVDVPDAYGAWSWIQPQLARILELRHRVTMMLAEDALATGAPDVAISVADVLLRIEPLDEPVVEVAARGLVAAGRRRDAVRRARRYADDLARDLGGEPVSSFLRELAAGAPHARAR